MLSNKKPKHKQSTRVFHKAGQTWDMKPVLALFFNRNVWHNTRFLHCIQTWKFFVFNSAQTNFDVMLLLIAQGRCTPKFLQWKVHCFISSRVWKFSPFFVFFSSCWVRSTFYHFFMHINTTMFCNFLSFCSTFCQFLLSVTIFLGFFANF
jgi:hypothetical protein